MLKHYYHKHDDYTIATYGGTRPWMQSFTPDVTFTCTGFTLFLAKVGTPAGTLTYSLYAVDGSGNPTGAAIASATVDYAGVSTIWPGKPVRATFSTGVVLSSGTQYVIVISLSGGNATNCIRINYKMVGDYSGGQAKYSTDSGANWVDTNGDLTFDLWDASSAGISRYYALVSTGGTGVWLETIYRDASCSTIEAAQSVVGRTAKFLLRSANYLYAVAFQTSTGTKISRYNLDLTLDTTWATAGILSPSGSGGCLHASVSQDDWLIVSTINASARGFLYLYNSTATQVWTTNTGINGKYWPATAMPETADYFVTGGNFGSGTNGSRLRRSDGAALLDFASSNGIVRLAIRESNSNSFTAMGTGGVTIREYLDDANTYLYSVAATPLVGTAADMMYIPDIDLLVVGTARANSVSIVTFNATTGAQENTFDTGAAVLRIEVDDDGNLLVCGVTGSDGVGISTFRQISQDISVLWRFDENFTDTMAGVTVGSIIIEISTSIEGTGTLCTYTSTTDPAGTPGDPITPIATIPTELVPVAYRPETPLIERLLFRTKINRSLDGVEERIRLRKCPRIGFEWKIAEGRQSMENLLYALAMDYMGAPFWHEPVYLTEAIAAGTNHAHVTSTASSQFLPGQWALIIATDGTCDLLEVDTVSSEEISFVAVPLHSYKVKTQVIPVSRCVTENITVTKRLDTAEYDIKVAVEPVDNDLDLTPYTDGELEVIDVSYVHNLKESFSRPSYRSDAQFGLFSQTVILEHADKGTQIGFCTHSRAELWSLREKLYRLGGRCVAFWLATFGRELTPTAALTSGQSTLTIENCGYTKHIQSRRGTLRIKLTDGTVISRTVVSSVVISDSTERITVDAVWTATTQVAEIDRIEYLDLVRLDSDEIAIRHQNALGNATCEIPVVFVYDQEV